MRQVVLDTETTGLSAEDGHRIIEIGCVEVLNRRITGRSLHVYINPERDIDQGALAVHGLTRERLESEPLFADVADRFLGFVDGAQVLIHNAPFDVGFLNAELRRLGRGRFESLCDEILDTLTLARELHPGKRNSLDALCDRYGISNAHRKLHGALLDAELLADVYLAMTRGQDSLSILDGERGQTRVVAFDEDGWPPEGLVVVHPDADELAAHLELVENIAAEAGRPSLWGAD
ncbi:MAG: DNA polymerase III subunit epsilon [Burkholderiaceae bacterium]|nr:DNA polymerase III subunit epsilon [Burkholderiaceae bacterium]